MQHLILLHGAIGHHTQLQPLAASLADTFHVHTLNFSGHGGKHFPAEPFSIPLFAAEIIAFMNENDIQQASIFGYSMGGYVAMYIAKNFSERVVGVITLATKFHWDETIAAKECQMLNAEKIEEKLPAFASSLKASHTPNDWKEVLDKTISMLQALGKQNTLVIEDYKSIETKTLVLLGDRDRMVSLDETVATYKALPCAQMGVLPNTGHPIEQVKTTQLQYFISTFLNG